MGMLVTAPGKGLKAGLVLVVEIAHHSVITVAVYLAPLVKALTRAIFAARLLAVLRPGGIIEFLKLLVRPALDTAFYAQKTLLGFLFPP
jgi:hypothetical protein